jgi:hypothetical protein
MTSKSGKPSNKFSQYPVKHQGNLNVFIEIFTNET